MRKKTATRRVGSCIWNDTAQRSYFDDHWAWCPGELTIMKISWRPLDSSTVLATYKGVLMTANYHSLSGTLLRVPSSGHLGTSNFPIILHSVGQKESAQPCSMLAPRWFRRDMQHFVAQYSNQVYMERRQSIHHLLGLHIWSSFLAFFSNINAVDEANIDIINQHL